MSELDNAFALLEQANDGLAQLIEGNETPITVGGLYSLHSIEIKNVRIENPQLETKEFYTNFDALPCNLMDLYHKSLGGTNMYEVFCDEYVIPSVDPIDTGSLQRLNTTNIVADQGYDIAVDANNIYVSYLGAPGLYQIDKETLSYNEIPGIGIVDARRLETVNKYLVYGTGTSPFYKIFDKSTGQHIDDLPPASITVGDIAVSEDYIMITHGFGQLIILDARTLEEIPNSINVGGQAYSIHISDSHVFVGGNFMEYVKAYELGTWIPMQLPEAHDMVLDIASDEDYVYLSHEGGGGLSILDRSTNQYLTGLPNYAYKVNSISVDDTHVYIATLAEVGNRVFHAIEKGSWSTVPNTPNVLAEGRVILRDANRVYILHERVDNNIFTVLEG